MGTPTSELLTRVRGLIPEADPIEWTDPVLLVLLNLEYFEWSASLGRLPGPGWFTIDVTPTLPAGETTIDLTGLMSPSSIGSFAALKSTWYRPITGEETPIESAAQGQEAKWRLPRGTQPVGQQSPQRKWLTRPAGVPTLNLHPVSSADADLRLYLRYQPPRLTNTGESAQTDPRHDDVLVMGTALRAMLNVGETDPVIKAAYEELKLRFLDEERNALGEHESETTKLEVSEDMFGS